LTETVKGTDKPAQRRAGRVMTRLLAAVDQQRAPETSIPLGRALDEWLRTVEIEATTRRTYVGYIERHVRPALGAVPIDKLSARNLETLYTDLRRCRAPCDGRPHIERHQSDGEHDCAVAGCVPHRCRPMANSTVRQIHSIISGTLSAAVRWDWISSNPARVAQRPRAKTPEPDPPSPADAARLLGAAFAMDDIGVEKDTKTHQMRWPAGSAMAAAVRPRCVCTRRGWPPRIGRRRSCSGRACRAVLDGFCEGLAGRRSAAPARGCRAQNGPGGGWRASELGTEPCPA
jgi:Phage integrase, N-terminal SAM-like domain